jgi:hypothetical protein
LERVSSWKPLDSTLASGKVTLSRPLTGGAEGQTFSAVQLSPPTTPGNVLDPRALDLPLVRGDKLVIQLAS